MQNFFQHQENARRNTGRLVFLFILGILLISALVYALAVGVFVYIGKSQGHGPSPSLWQPMILLASVIGVIAIVGLGSLYKVSQLSSGGSSVALMVGGREIQPSTKDWREKRLLNIVEEMSIASGVPMPPVYILPDEAGINAFAAGYAQGDAVVAVSQGSLDYLSRDELQGVVAHEFSHILNGDMRLNIRLMGLIYGLIVLSIVGYFLLRMAGSSSSSYSGRKKDSGAAQFFLLGLGLLILGWIGSVIGQMIQAAISRQREFLADSSAVQFTRNPFGIAGALKKIGGMEYGSEIKHPESKAVSHMFFADAVIHRFSDLLATHPPLPERIKRLEPSWTGEYPPVHKLHSPTDEESPKKKTKPPLDIAGLPTIPGIPNVPAPVILNLSADEAISRIGTIPLASEETASAIHEQIPDIIRDAAHDPYSARALIYCLLLDSRPEIREKQLNALRQASDENEVRETMKLEESVRALPDAIKLPVMDISLPALRQMSKAQYHDFREIVQKLIDADEELSLFEYVLHSLLKHYLQQNYEPQKVASNRFHSLKPILPDVIQVLSQLAWEGSDSPEEAEKAFAAGLGVLSSYGVHGELVPLENCTLRDFDSSLSRLKGATNRIKQRIIEVCAACVLADQKVTIRENELLRAICGNLDCPLPILGAPSGS
jgi:Zn-dependent protease with chaperone function